MGHWANSQVVNAVSMNHQTYPEYFQGFQDFYDNKEGVLDANADFYATVAKRFAGRSALLGYEVFNEPFTGDIYSDPLRLLPGIAGQEYFVGYYNKVHEKIREADDESILFWEPVIYCTFFY